MTTELVDSRVSYEPLAVTKRKILGFAVETSALMTALGVVSLAAILEAVVIAGVLLWGVHVGDLAARQVPVFVGIAPDGTYKTLDPEMFRFPTGTEFLKSPLIQFIKLHMQRIPATVTEDFANSLLFLDAPLIDPVSRAQGPNVKAVSQGDGEEIRVDVSNVSFRNLRSGCLDSECYATVPVKKKFYTAASHAFLREENSTVELSFVRSKSGVTPGQIKVGNPGGLIITEIVDNPYLNQQAPK